MPILVEILLGEDDDGDDDESDCLACTRRLVSIGMDLCDCGPGILVRDDISVSASSGCATTVANGSGEIECC